MSRDLAHDACAAGAAGHSARDVVRNFVRDLVLCLTIAAALVLILTPGPVLARYSARQFAGAFAGYAIVTLSMGLVVSTSLRTLCPAFDRRVAHRGLQRLFMGAVFALGVLAGGEIAVRLLALLDPLDVREARWNILRVGVVVSAIAVIGIVSFEHLRRRAREHELREQQARQEALRAQLAALSARTNPHFLFNSLNTVGGLIETDPRLAERVLEKFAGLFRYALSGSQRAWVRLDDELAHVRDYLEVEQIRFGERLSVEIDCAGATGAGDAADDAAGAELGGTFVPPLVLQPLVENAVLHGVAPRPEGGRVRVGVRATADEVELTVEDDGPGPGASAHRGTGTALGDLRARLELVYEGRASIETGSADGAGYRVVLRLPRHVPQEKA